MERLLVFGFLGFSFDGEYGTQHQYAYQLPSRQNRRANLCCLSFAHFIVF
ncbi:hypothetical protein Peur_071905 [Populus x canadensis]